MIGQTVSHYRITEKLGEGGMGEVYLAEDTRLDRKVALKFLPESLQADDIAHKRFLREAKSAAALDHPFICNIHEIRQHEGHDFIVMEYVQGQTLQAELAKGVVSLKEALRIGVEVAEALEVAHQKGIVHRDLKPSNIMLTPQGHVKVMDFGLAKKVVTEEGKEEDITSVLTREGSTLGTLAYMSPEQVRGDPVDQRSDIFSFGVVLYELLTGVHPFRGDRPAETSSAILKDTPAALSIYLERASEVLQHTLDKMLAKRPDDRYQLAHEVRTNLSRLLQEAVPEPQKLRFWRRLALPAGLVVLAAVLYWFWPGISRESPGPPMKVVPLTSLPGWEGYPALSPDGNNVAFCWAGENQIGRLLAMDVYVKPVKGGRPLQLTDSLAQERWPTWSPDGQLIAFVRYDETFENMDILTISPLGPPERKLARVRSGQGLDWSPDGKWLAFSGATLEGDAAAIHLLSLETLEIRRLTVPHGEKWSDHGPEFSPDGQLIAFVRTPGLTEGNLLIVSVSGGEPKELITEGDVHRSICWTADGQEIIFTTYRGGNAALWRIGISGGEARPVAAATENANYPSISAQGDRLAYTRDWREVDIWRLDLSKTGESESTPVRVIASTQWDMAPAISPDGQSIAFSSYRSGYLEIWRSEADGSNPVKLTSMGASNAFAGKPRWSPNGRLIAFVYIEGTSKDIFVTDADGGLPRQITSSASDDIYPSWSTDGEWIYFSSDRSGEFQIWKKPVKGGEAIQVTRRGGEQAFESSDGQFVFYTKAREAGIWKVPSTGGEETLVVEYGTTSLWALGTEGVYFCDSEQEAGPGIKRFDLTSGETRRVASTEGWITRISVSPDETWIAYQRIIMTGDLMLVEDFR